MVALAAASASPAPSAMAGTIPSHNNYATLTNISTQGFLNPASTPGGHTLSTGTTANVAQTLTSGANSALNAAGTILGTAFTVGVGATVGGALMHAAQSTSTPSTNSNNVVVAAQQQQQIVQQADAKYREGVQESQTYQDRLKAEAAKQQRMMSMSMNGPGGMNGPTSSG